MNITNHINRYFYTYIIIGLLSLTLWLSALFQYGTVSYVEFTVQDKERVCSGGENTTCRYLVFTDNGVFENTDSLFHLKYSSADMQSSLSVGGTYRAKVYGWRVPFFSMYKNIVALE